MKDDARVSTHQLRLSRETIRELDSANLRQAAGGQANLTLPPTFCQCTGTETATNVCCLQVAN